MREVLGTRYAYLKGRMRRNRNLGISFAFAGLLVPIIFLVMGIPLPWFYISVLLWSISSGYFYKYQNLKRGMRGERKVADALKRLDDSYYVFHDVVIGPHSSNIDHIVVGPNGIFVIETKNYSGEIVCEGDEWYRVYGWDKVRIKSVSVQAKRNAAIVGGLLRRKGVHKWVQPLIVFTDPP